MITIKPSQNRWKNSTWILAGILLLSLVGNWFQISLRKNDRIAKELSEARNQIEIEGHKALAKSYGDRAREVDSLRIRERDSTKVAVSGLKMRLQALREKDNQVDIEPWGPIMVTIDTAGYYWEGTIREFNNKAVGCLLKDTIIQVQDSLISTLELTNMSQARDFEEIIRLNRAQIQEQVAVSNTLQEMLVEQQGKTRKEIRKKKVWRFIAGVGVAAAGILLLKPN